MLCTSILKPGSGRKRRTIAIEVFLYGIFLPMVLFAHPHRNSLSAYVFALLLSLGMVGTMIALAVMAVRQTDEFQRAVLTKAMLWGIGGTLSINTISGLLEFFTDARPLPLLASFPIFLVVFLSAKAWLFRGYRIGNE